MPKTAQAFEGSITIAGTTPPEPQRRLRSIPPPRPEPPQQTESKRRIQSKQLRRANAFFFPCHSFYSAVKW